jgi:hypothetical protein
MDHISHDDDDIARLFRDNDNIGSDSSLWLRPLRQLFIDGKPVSKVVALMVSPIEPIKLPFGMLTQTERNRFIFWPILPSGVKMRCDGEKVDVFDHITLEFPSEKIHTTTYDIDGLPIHNTRAWGTHSFSDSDLALWFILLVRVSILRQQDMAVQQCVKMPTTDKERRINEFVRYPKNISLLNVPLPPCKEECDYIYFSFYLAPDSIKIDQSSFSNLPSGSAMDSEIEGWDDGNEFQVKVSHLTFDQRTICVATACPPGRLRSDVSVGFPRRMKSK